jgi:mannose-1-phosphate guanylyltransferase
MRLFPIIIAGGSGTRFWPLSRQRRPKQFLPLVDQRPMINATFDRARKLAGPENVFVVCGKLHQSQVRRALSQLPPENVLAEPFARNTAPAIGLAAVHVQRKDPRGVLLVLPSDHHIAKVPAFIRCLREASRLAADGELVTLGIRPTHPETGYGYIRLGHTLKGKGRRVAAFVEKPDRLTAQRYLASGKYLWNSGIFAFRVDVILDALRRYLPRLGNALDQLAGISNPRRFAAELTRVFKAEPSVSIDYGVMEKATNIAVVPGDFGWSDVGSFLALGEVRRADRDGNIVLGETLQLDCKNSILVSNRRLIAAVGLSDLIVVESADAVLVIPKARSQDVRRVAEALRVRRWKHLL